MTWLDFFGIIYIIEKLGKGFLYKEIPMENYIFTEVDLVYLFILGFAIHMSYIAGKHKGMSNTIDYMEAKGYIDLDDE